MAANKAKKHLDIYLYGVIGGSRVNAQRFIDELQAAGTVDTITVYLNTVGGSFYDGLPIYNTLKQHSAVVTMRVMGYALSMGSVVMLAGDRIEAAENSLLMIHRAQAAAVGDADELMKAVEVLLKHEAAIIPEYSRRMGLSAEEVAALLADETWYTAEEAKQAGLIDAVIGEVVIDDQQAGISAESLDFACSRFRKVPDALSSGVNVSANQTAMPGQEFNELETVIKAMSAAFAQAVKDANEPVINAINLITDHVVPSGDEESELESLRKQLVAANQEIIDLSVPDPTKNTPRSINTGPVGDDAGDWWDEGDNKNNFM